MRPSAHELAALILLAASATGCAASAPPREPRLPMCAGEPAPNSGDWLKRTDDPAARRRAFATGEPVVNGRCTVPPALIQRAAMARLEDLRTCFDAARARDPKIEGQVLTRFQLVPGGKTGQVCATETTIQDAELIDCVVGVMREMNVATDPPAECSMVAVTYPLLFIDPSSAPALWSLQPAAH